MNPPLLIENGTLLSTGPVPRIRSGHSVLIEDGLISRVAPARRFGGFAGRRIDAAGKVVIPGLINAHTHLYSSFARGLTKARPASSFAAVLRNLWWRLDSALTLEDCYCSALVGLIDSIRHGTTAVVDHHASPCAVAGSLSAIEKAVDETGIRACLCYEVSDRDGGRVARQGLDENAAFIRHCGRDAGGRVRALFGLHASFTLSDATLERAAGIGAELGAGFHIHVAEGPGDQAAARRRSGRRVVERLGDFGILGPRTLAAHCIDVDSREIGLLARTRTAVIHNPQSNLNNAVGIARVVEMARRGVVVGLGTDAMTANMLEELRVALWAQRLGSGDPSAGFSEVTSALFANNAAIAGAIFGLPFGSISAGSAADLVILDYDPPTPLADSSALGHVVFGLSQAPVDTTIAAGRVLMANRRLELGLDEARVNARARELAANLWKRF